jgi:CheY-like chemotaxis protein
MIEMVSLLLVDDDEMGSQILSYILIDEGYSVDIATTGGAAVEKTSEHIYDLVFLDYKLPDMTGHDVAQRIKKITPKTKIVLLTGYTKEGDPRENLYEKILLKPVPPTDIIRVITEALRVSTGSL